ncbi:MAG: RecX family transcriptional regulator [candidate division WOR-3 bacterium]
MKITKIERAKKNKEKVNVFVDGEYSFSTYDQLLIKFDIFTGKDVDDNWIDSVEKETQIFDSKRYLYRILSKRRYTENQIREKLFLRKVDREIIERLLEEFKANGLIDDGEYIKDYLDYLKSQRKYSKKEIESKLFLKFKKVFDSVFLKESLDDYDERNILENLLRREKNFDEKLVQKYYRKGFDFEDVREIFNKIKKGG